MSLAHFVHCERHHAAVEVEVGPLKPAPPPSRVCRQCLEEADPSRQGDGLRAVTQKLDVEDLKLGSKAAELGDAWRERQIASGRLLTKGAEADALEKIDRARVDAIAADHAPKGARNMRVVTSRVIDGEVVDFLKLRGIRGLHAVRGS